MKIKPAKQKKGVILELGRKDEKILEISSRASTPFHLQKILVPVDFSECSLKAVHYAVPFARQFGASVTLVYVMQQYYMGSDVAAGLEYAELEKELADNAEKELKALLKKEIGPGIKSSSVLRNGRPVDQICRVAKEQDSDLIIISTHGHTGLKHVFLGSTAENVVRHAPCPVLTVRVHEHDFVD